MGWLQVIGESLSFLFWWKKKSVEDAENPEKQKEVRHEKINEAIAKHDEKILNTQLDSVLDKLRE